VKIGNEQILLTLLKFSGYAVEKQNIELDIEMWSSLCHGVILTINFNAYTEEGYESIVALSGIICELYSPNIKL
jgi:hypothetical protein